MESKAHYALIGFFVIASIIAAFFAVVWLSGSTLDQGYDEYTVTFDGPVRGIAEAAEVRFNGIKVGEVTAIRLDPEDPNKVLVRIEVFTETPVDTASYAQLEPQGLTGLNIIQLSSGGGAFPLLKDMPGRGPYIIEGRASQFDSLLSEGGSIVEATQKALNGLNVAFDDESIANMKQILDNINAITRQYRDAPITAERIEQTLAIIDQAARDVSTASLAVDQTSLDTSLLIQDEIKPVIARLMLTMGEIDETVIKTQTLLSSATGVTDKTQGLITEISNVGLKDIERATQDLTELLATLNRIADELERSPASFVVGEKQDIMELPQ